MGNFRPCIDIHDGAVKQIIGGTLDDERGAGENYVSARPASYYAAMYREDSLKGAHVIMLNHPGSPMYEKTREQAIGALREYPGGMQAGGSVNDENARVFLDAGASHVIVTSFVFKDGVINMDNLERLRRAVGKERTVLDLSCRFRDGDYYIVTDRWQKFTDVKLSPQTLERLAEYADEFLVHAADIEGRKNGPDEAVVDILASYDGIPVTYAGGIRNLEDIDKIKKKGGGRVNFTIGSALDIFGGDLPYLEVKNL
ncbi:MAG: phosphoribosylformimino-5-aminoimidazole carboxamide ribotide isomerase [Eubacterium sp.]|nr:phosphoribosylformimino-5-aminoimidazole carboxamide ribotide isomerase [Eubacterium sp.]